MDPEEESSNVDAKTEKMNKKKEDTKERKLKKKEAAELLAVTKGGVQVQKKKKQKLNEVNGTEIIKEETNEKKPDVQSPSKKKNKKK